MSADLEAILRLEVPLIVQIGERTMPLNDVVGLAPGSIIELPKSVDDDLDLLVNNQVVGSGRAVKVGENFGVRVTAVGHQRDRVGALADDSDAAPGRTIP